MGSLSHVNANGLPVTKVIAHMPDDTEVVGEAATRRYRHTQVRQHSGQFIRYINRTSSRGSYTRPRRRRRPARY